MAVIGLIAAPIAHAATIPINYAGDETTVDGNCALREALINANNDDEADFPECDFDETTPFGADTITINTSIQLSSLLNGDDDTALLGDLDVTDDLTIQGATNLTLQAGTGFTSRLLEVPSAGDDLILNDFKLQGATVTTAADDGGQGGAVRFVGDATSALTLSNMWVTQNTVAVPAVVNRGGGVSAFGAGTQVMVQNGTVIDVNSVGVGIPGVPIMGGGISVIGGGVGLSVTESEVKNNRAGGSAAAASGGGGIYYQDTGLLNPTLTITDAVIDGNITGGDNNDAPGDGGGIQIDSPSTATVNITDTQITTNQAAPGPGTATGKGGGLLADTTGADINLDNVLVDQNTAGGNDNTGLVVGSGAGGGIYSMSDLDVTNGSVISRNDAGVRVGGGTGLGEGGGINVVGIANGDQDVTISESSLTDNEAGTSQGIGGGLDMASDGDLSISDSVISDNLSASASGGIQRSDHDGGPQPTDSILRSTLADNRAGSTPGGTVAGAGAGMTLESSGVMTIESSTFDHNVTGAAVGVLGTGQGGGLVATSALDSPAPGSDEPGSLTIVNSTFSDNRADSASGGGDGGGLVTIADPDHLAPEVSITASTFAENLAFEDTAGGQGGNLILAAGPPSSVQITGSIITDGLGAANQGNCSIADSNTVNSVGGSVEGPALEGGPPVAIPPTDQCELDGAGDLHADPLLGPLQLNAPVTTMTHAIAAGSPALERYTAGCPGVDQRGVSRPQGPACDAGAFEGPAPAAAVVDSAAPETTITKRPKNKVTTKKKKVKVSFEFASSEPGQGGFQCQIDNAEFVDCGGSFSVKVKAGKHTFRVRAYDAAGNPDPTLETDSFKVKRKKPK